MHGELVIGGPTTAASALRQLLHDRLRDRLTIDSSIPMLVSDATARTAIERCISRLSHALQRKAVLQVLDGVGAAGRGVVGLRDTAAAVAAGQVETLLLTRRFLGAGVAARLRFAA